MKWREFLKVWVFYRGTVPILPGNFILFLESALLQYFITSSFLFHYRGKSDDGERFAAVEKKAPSVEHLTQELSGLALNKRTIAETPIKDPSGLFNLPTPVRKAQSSATRVIPETPSGSAKKPLSTPKQTGSVEKKPLASPKTPITRSISSKMAQPSSASKLTQPTSASKASTQPNSASRPVQPTTAFKANALHPAASPVGMYIRSLPEPMLIENVRSSAKKKEVQTNPSAIKPPRMAIKNKEGRWSIARTPSNESPSPSAQPADIKPVLPVVLHEAAASMVFSF